MWLNRRWLDLSSSKLGKTVEKITKKKLAKVLASCCVF